jgi:hypothetical protein
MHRIMRNTYVGAPGEAAQVATIVHAGGQIRLLLDGQDLGNNRVFSLPGVLGQQRHLHIDLAGPIGASCAVGISTVDGGTDGDLLLCQPLNPQPAGDYFFQVAAPAAVNAFAALRGLIPSQPAAPAGPRKSGKGAAKGGR